MDKIVKDTSSIKLVSWTIKTSCREVNTMFPSKRWSNRIGDIQIRAIPVHGVCAWLKINAWVGVISRLRDLVKSLAWAIASTIVGVRWSRSLYTKACASGERVSRFLKKEWAYWKECKKERKSRRLVFMNVIRILWRHTWHLLSYKGDILPRIIYLNTFLAIR